MVCVAATSPYFGINLFRGIKRWRKYKNKRRNFTDAFKRLEKRGCIKIKMVNHQIYISLTEKGKKLAGWMQIDALKIKRPKNGMADGGWLFLILPN